MIPVPEQCERQDVAGSTAPPSEENEIYKEPTMVIEALAIVHRLTV